MSQRLLQKVRRSTLTCHKNHLIQKFKDMERNTKNKYNTTYFPKNRVEISGTTVSKGTIIISTNSSIGCDHLHASLT